MQAYSADRSLGGKLRRRWTRLVHRRPLARSPDRPLVSFTFDDAPLSAALAGAEALEARGLRGVFYISAGLAGGMSPMGVCAEASHYRRLADMGHEIACHTFSHCDLGQADAQTARAEADRNGRALADWGLPPARSFAYPYGDVSPGPKAALSDRFATLRGLHPGAIRRGADLNQLPAVGVEGPGGDAAARRWLDQAQRRPAWLILYTHDVCDTPSPWGCTPRVWGGLMDEALARGFEVVTVAEASRRLGV